MGILPPAGPGGAWHRAIVAGASLAFVDVLLTYLAGSAPARDAVVIAAVPWVLMASVGLLGRFVPLAARELPLLSIPVLLFGLRGCVVSCELEGPGLTLRWAPTVVLLGVAVALAIERPCVTLAGFAVRALVVDLVAALAFGVRTDQYPAFDARVVAQAVAVCAAAAALAWWGRNARAPVFAGRESTAAAAACLAIALAGRSAAPELPGSAPVGGSGNVLAAGSTRLRPNVVLIVLDTVRADHLGLYGYPRDTSPNLDALGRESLVFDKARANSTYSLASHASLLTGRRPSTHGAHQIPHGWSVRHPRLNSAVGSFALRPGMTTLAEELQARGYRTAGISANDVYLAPWTGLQRGFSAFHASARRRYRYAPLAAPVMVRAADLVGHPFNAQDTWPAETVVDGATRWIASSTQPFFLFLNLFDAHSPYAPRGGSRFRGDGRGKDTARVPEYDEEVRQVDEQVGRLMRFLQGRKLLDSTVVVVTADHGEFFGEHDLYGHAPHLFEPVLRVPLIVRIPGVAARRVDGNVGLNRVKAMITGVVDGSVGNPLFAASPEPQVIAESWASSDVSYGSERLQPWSVAVYSADLKLVHFLDGRADLRFDLATDPQEARSLGGGDPRFAGLAAAARNYLGRPLDDPNPGAADSDAVERLRALGYVK